MCWAVVPCLIMFLASDDEGSRPAQPGPSRHRRNLAVAPMPSDLAFLQQSCSCKRLTCLRQFLDMGEMVRAKRQEFKDLPDHKKARVLEMDRQDLFHFWGLSVPPTGL